MERNTWISVLALLVAVITFAWRLRDERVSYLQIGLSVLDNGGRFALAKISIKNDSVRIKKLAAAFVIIGPVDEDPIDTFNVALQRKPEELACCAIDFERLVPEERATDASRSRQVIPLPYFTEENDNVGDEELLYSLPIDMIELPQGAVLSVRFYVYGCRRSRQNYHRKVHDILITPRTANDSIRTGSAENNGGASSGGLCDAQVSRPAATCRSIRGCPRKLRSTRDSRRTRPRSGDA